MLYADTHQFFEDNLIRPHTYNGELYLFAVDLANALGVGSQTVTRLALKNGGEIERVRVSEITDLLADRDDYVVPTAGQPVRIMLNLGAVFAVLMSTRSAKADPFKRWVTQVLLPNYYRNGYVTREEYEEMEARAVIAETRLLMLDQITQ